MNNAVLRHAVYGCVVFCLGITCSLYIPIQHDSIDRPIAQRSPAEKNPSVVDRRHDRPEEEPDSGAHKPAEPEVNKQPRMLKPKTNPQESRSNLKIDFTAISGTKVYDSIMVLIEPELVIGNLPATREKYRNETDNQRKLRMKRYQKAFVLYEKCFAAYMKELNDLQAESDRIARRVEEERRRWPNLNHLQATTH